MTIRGSLPKAGRCVAHRTDGSPCKAYAIRGATVCVVHGGSTNHVKENARRRLATMVEPALDSLHRLLTNRNGNVALRAIENVLDRNDIVAIKTQTDGNQLTIQVQYADVDIRPPKVIDVTPKVLEDGHTNGTAH